MIPPPGHGAREASHPRSVSGRRGPFPPNPPIPLRCGPRPSRGSGSAPTGDTTARTEDGCRRSADHHGTSGRAARWSIVRTSRARAASRADPAGWRMWRECVGPVRRGLGGCLTRPRASSEYRAGQAHQKQPCGEGRPVGEGGFRPAPASVNGMETPNTLANKHPSWQAAQGA